MMSLNAQRYGRRPQPADADYDDDATSTLRPTVAGIRGACVLGIYARLAGHGKQLSDMPERHDAERVLGLEGLCQVIALNDMWLFDEAWRELGSVLFERGEWRGVSWFAANIQSAKDLDWSLGNEPPLGLGDRIKGLLAGVRAVQALRSLACPSS